MNTEELKDFYAGLAMLGLIVNGDFDLNRVPDLANKVADEMVRLKIETDLRREAM